MIGATDLRERVRFTEIRCREGYMAEWRQEEDGAICWWKPLPDLAPPPPSARASAALSWSIFTEVLQAQVERAEHILAGSPLRLPDFCNTGFLPAFSTGTDYSACAPCTFPSKVELSNIQQTTGPAPVLTPPSARCARRQSNPTELNDEEAACRFWLATLGLGVCWLLALLTRDRLNGILLAGAALALILPPPPAARAPPCRLGGIGMDGLWSYSGVLHYSGQHGLPPDHRAMDRLRLLVVLAVDVVRAAPCRWRYWAPPRPFAHAVSWKLTPAALGVPPEFMLLLLAIGWSIYLPPSVGGRETARPLNGFRPPEQCRRPLLIRLPDRAY